MNNKKILQTELNLLEKLREIITSEHQNTVENMIQQIQEELDKYER